MIRGISWPCFLFKRFFLGIGQQSFPAIALHGDRSDKRDNGLGLNPVRDIPTGIRVPQNAGPAGDETGPSGGRPAANDSAASCGRGSAWVETGLSALSSAA